MAMRGKELRLIRKRLGWTQVDMAKAVGVDPNTVARWERDEIAISEPVARLIRTTVAPRKKKARR